MHQGVNLSLSLTKFGFVIIDMIDQLIAHSQLCKRFHLITHTLPLLMKKQCH